ncbi:PhzF family phenazine biosynthesis protein [Hoeflea alexandrii]|uniref:PhzF family phenazine biosynthesis protein n=1 Tax=Hoeflea alexandrii TaxID=288436 RepID=UPI0022AFE3E5|nr:PhzF family phenazine biosynthesis protein [Hoeflea alexandrii]MCZ4289935.1 PhzF family phenazine biosynthesis protein [Hoeflea alexandrii]
MTEYAIYDVFTGTALAGNPLAVVFDADHLSDGQMQAIAREFNLSETVFVLKPENPVHTARLRIFTSQRELPFAGHPTVGAAVALADRRLGGTLPANGIDMVKMLEEKIGQVRCAVRLQPGKAGFAEFDLPKLSRQLDVEIEPADIGAALGLDPHEIGFENHRVSLWSAGVPFVMVPVHDLAAAAKADCNAYEWERFAPMGDGQLAFAYVYCRGGVNHAASFHARMFAPGDGMPEDPATGSAAAALSGAIHHFDGLPEGKHALVIEQGVEMGRPSLIHLHIDCAGTEVSHVRIGGEAVRIAEGKLMI